MKSSTVNNNSTYHHFIILLLGVLLIFVACTRIEDKTSNEYPHISTQGIVARSTKPSTGLSTLSITSTPTPRSFLITPAAAIAEDNKGHSYQKNCVQIYPEIPLINKPKGTLIFADYESKRSIFFNISTGKKNDWVDGDISSIHTSPDGKWFAYYIDPRITPPEVVVESANSQDQLRWKDENWVTIYRWIDNEHLALIRAGQPELLTEILNPFTGERKIFGKDYPDSPAVNITSRSFNFYGINFLPDPSLQMVVYQQIKDGLSVVLMDGHSNEIMGEIALKHVLEHDPIWSTDGADFVLPVPVKKSSSSPALNPWIFDWMKVDREGNIQQLTFLENYFRNPIINKASRSPDNKYLAFWLTEGLDPIDRHLLILDIEMKVVHNTCIHSVHNNADWSPIWSPDSNFVSVANEFEDSVFQTMVVNINENWATTIENGLIPIGWIE